LPGTDLQHGKHPRDAVPGDLADRPAAAAAAASVRARRFPGRMSCPGPDLRWVGRGGRSVGRGVSTAQKRQARAAPGRARRGRSEAFAVAAGSLFLMARPQPMLPEKYQWITAQFEPEGDPWMLFEIALQLEREGNLEAAATVYDRAFGINPTADLIQLHRRHVLDQLAVTEYGIRFCYIPGGVFLMGCERREPDERPWH